MKIFLAGATGAVGKRLVPLLVKRGHSVLGTTRTSERAGALWDAGAEPVVLDPLNGEAVRRAVVSARPDVVVNQLTALSQLRNLKRFDDEFATTNRLRTEGTQYLLEAAQEAGTRRFVAQSYAGWPSAPTGSRIKTEEDPLDPNPPQPMARTLAAIRQLESSVVGAAGLTGVVLRYGPFYGPGTSIAEDGDVVKAVRKRWFPIVGRGTGVWSFIHIDDVAAATLLAIEGGPAGVYNIVDDEPAEVSVWLPELARAIGAPAPFRVPEWLGGLLVGEVGVSLMNRTRGSSNAKAKRTWNWQPQFASWREGFRHGLAAGAPHRTPAPAALRH